MYNGRSTSIIADNFFHYKQLYLDYIATLGCESWHFTSIVDIDASDYSGDINFL